MLKETMCSSQCRNSAAMLWRTRTMMNAETEEPNHKRKTLLFKIPNGSSRSQSTISSSTYFKCVCLHDWWLLKPHPDKGLAVGGCSSREGQLIRVFSSAAIAKRHDTNTLETTDGFTVTITGFINRSRTHENGFPPEVCNHFLFGFPYNWKEYGAGCYFEESSRKNGPKRTSSFDKFDMSSCNVEKTFQPISLDDLPATWRRDLLMCTYAESDSHKLTQNILKDLFEKLGGDDFHLTGQLIHSEMGNELPTRTADSLLDKTPVSHRKAEPKKVKYESGRMRVEESVDNDDSDMGNELSSRTVHSLLDETISRRKKVKGNKFTAESGRKRVKESKDISHQFGTRSIATRSMTRMKKLQNKRGKEKQGLWLVVGCSSKESSKTNDSKELLASISLIAFLQCRKYLSSFRR